jgi:peptidoglycan hydrolase-like protein with peptidoglycan-binding domain
MGREIFEEAYRHFTQEGRRYEYGRGDISLRNHSPNGHSDTSRTEQDLDGDGLRGVDCSSLVWRGLRNAGYDVGKAPFATSQLFNGKHATPYAREHFDIISSADASRPHGALQEGDIIMFRSKHGQHVGIFRGYDAQGNIQFFGSQVSTGPAMVTTGTRPGGYWNGGDFEIVGALRAKPEFQVRKPLHEPGVAATAAAGTAQRAAEPRTQHEGDVAPSRAALEAGARGDDVRKLQADLARLGYGSMAGRALKVDGEFGPLTATAVRRFQEDRHLHVNGIADAQTRDAIRQGTLASAAGAQLDNAAHPDHELYRQALGAVRQLDAQHRRDPGEHSENLAGALTVAARREGLSKIDHVILSEDKSHTYAVQGDIDSPLKRIAGVSTAEAAVTPIKGSSASLEMLSSLAEDRRLQLERRGHIIEVIKEHRAERQAEREAHPNPRMTHER